MTLVLVQYCSVGYIGVGYSEGLSLWVGNEIGVLGCIGLTGIDWVLLRMYT